MKPFGYTITSILQRPKFSGSVLKVVAMISMVIDHCAYYLLEHGTVFYEAMRCVGRIAFPVFAFLIAEGFAHTRNQKRYFLQLLGFAIISEVPWFLLNGADGTHNVMFTLALGVVALALLDWCCEHKVLSFMVIALVAVWAYYMGTDYDWRGVLMIAIFYMTQPQADNLQGWMIQILFTLPLMLHYGTMGAILASVVILPYNGDRGFITGKAWKYAFYAFYPVHLLLIYTLVAVIQ